MAMIVNRFDVVLTNRDPTVGSEIQKTRPCLIISPDDLNEAKRNADKTITGIPGVKLRLSGGESRDEYDFQ
jgi:mRNA-degrading endonuclease toxin of MazEF toxin-antitoxin module